MVRTFAEKSEKLKIILSIKRLGFFHKTLENIC